MPGTKAGGEAAAKTNKNRYGDDFYAKIGARGGATPSIIPKGFAADRNRARWAGRLGGRNSKRKKETS